MSVDCTITLSPDTSEFTKRIMFGNFMGNLDNEVKNAADEIVDIGVKHIRTHLYPGHGYITGNLQNSYTGKSSMSGHDAHITILTECFYALFVEYGTFKMSPRAHFRPGIQETEEDVERIFGGAIDRFISGISGSGSISYPTGPESLGFTAPSAKQQYINASPSRTWMNKL